MMQAIRQQEDLAGVAKLINAYLRKAIRSSRVKHLTSLAWLGKISSDLFCSGRCRWSW